MTHYYAIDNSGMATLCADLQDAIKSAKEYAEQWPKRAPYTVATMAPVDAAVMSDKPACGAQNADRERQQPDPAMAGKCSACNGAGGFEAATSSTGYTWKDCNECKRVQPASAAISDDLLRFLHGSGEIDNVAFGEPHPKHRGKFWWRALLPQPAEPHPASGEDAKRLDWLDRVAHCADWVEDEPTKRVIRACDGAEFHGDTWRDAIDAAMQQESKP